MDVRDLEQIEKTERTKMVLVRSTLNLIIWLVVLSALIVVGSMVIPYDLNKYLTYPYFLIGVYGYAIYSHVRYGFNLKRYLEVISAIHRAKSVHDNPLAYLKARAVFLKNNLALDEKVLDLQKLLSPTPLVLYFFGAIVENKVQAGTNIFGFHMGNFPLKDVLVFTGVALFVAFVTVVRGTYLRYKRNLLIYSLFAQEIVSLEEEAKKMDPSDAALHHMREYSLDSGF